MRVGKILILVLLMLFFIKPVLAETTYTTTTDTICKNGVCTKTLYSGIRNVYEDNTWKRVEYARSLKDKGFNIITLEEDKDYPVEVIDFNYTSIKVKLNPKGVKVFNENIPLRVWNNNDEKAQQFEKDVKDGKKISKGIEDYKEKMDKTFEQEIGFNLLNQEEEMTLDFGMGKILEFGFNSTTIILQDDDTENLEDTYLSFNDSTPNGDNTYLYLWDTSSADIDTVIKFSLLQLPTSISIINSSLYFKSAQIGGTVCGANVYSAENQSWEENQVFNLTNHKDSLLINATLLNTITFSNDGAYQEGINVTDGVKWFLSLGYMNASFYLERNKAGSSSLYSKEGGSSSSDPYLSITYYYTISPNITINSPLNQTYNTNSILFNITALGYETVDTCEYSLTGGTTNYSMSNAGNDWTATNSTMTQGSHTVNFYCNDTTGNLNNTEEIVFQTIFKTIGNRTQEYQMDEGSGIVLYDINSGLNGVLNGATWQDDGVDITLTEDTDYTLVTDSFTVINLNYAWRAITASYNYKDSQSSTTTIIARLSLLFIVLGILSFILLIINHYVKQI